MSGRICFSESWHMGLLGTTIGQLSALSYQQCACFRHQK